MTTTLSTLHLLIPVPDLLAPQLWVFLEPKPKRRTLSTKKSQSFFFLEKKKKLDKNFKTVFGSVPKDSKLPQRS